MKLIIPGLGMLALCSGLLTGPVVTPPIERASAPVEPPPPLAVLLDSHDIISGNSDSNGRIVVEYADFECTHCATQHPLLVEVLASAPDVQHRFRNYPLSAACNPLSTRTTQDDRCTLAAGAVCAAQIGQFERYAELAFATRLGVFANEPFNDVLWASCFAQPETFATVEAQARTAAELDLTGTPTFFVYDGASWSKVHTAADIAALLQVPSP